MVSPAVIGASSQDSFTLHSSVATAANKLVLIQDAHEEVGDATALYLGPLGELSLEPRKRHRFCCWMDCQIFTHHLTQQTLLFLERHAFLDRVHAQAADLISSKPKQFGVAGYGLCLLDF